MTWDRRRERRRRAWRCRGAGFSDLIARSAAALTSSSTSRTMAFSSASLAMSSCTRNVASRVIGSRLALRRALVGRLVQLLVVRQRVRVRADHLGVHERRALARARVVDGRGHRLVAGEEVGAVDALDEEAGERGDELRDVAAGRLHFDRDGNRVAVVLDQVDDRELERARGVERLPELPFAGGAFADRDVGDLVGLVERLASFDRGDPLVHAARFRRADGVQALRARRARLRHDVERRVAPVRRHLPAAGVRIVLAADRAEEHLERRHAEHQAQRAVAVVGMKPVVAGLQDHARRREDAFVSGAADLEEDQALVLELDFLVVQLPRQHHDAVRAEEILRRKPFEGAFPGADRRRFHVPPLYNPAPAIKP